MATVVRSIGAASSSISSVASPGILTVPTGHKFTAGEWCWVTGSTVAGLNDLRWLIASKTATTITLTGAPAGSGGAGGTIRREYTDPVSWEVATSIDLAGNIEAGEMYDDDGLGFTITTASTQLVIAGATNITLTAYRILRAGTGLSAATGYSHRYNPYQNKGVRILKDQRADSVNSNGIEIAEPGVRCQDFGILATTSAQPTSGASYGILISNTTSNAAAIRCNSIYVQWDQIRTGATGDCFYVNASVPADNPMFFNCIAVGGGATGYGARYGFYYGCFSSTGAILNCLAYGCKFSAGSRGFYFADTISVPSFQNCIAINNAQDIEAVYATPVWDRIITEDSSCKDEAALGTQKVYPNRSPDNLFVYAEFSDFRNLPSSSAVANGTHTLAETYFTKDFADTTRTIPWEIGPYDGVVDPATAAPTEVVKTIGAAAGRDYVTFAAWEVATRQDLVYGLAPWANTVQIGEVYDDNGTSFAGVTLSGATTDSTRYRILRPASGHRYNPLTGQGVRVVETTATGAAVIKVVEPHSTVEGFYVDNTNSTPGTDVYGVWLTGSQSKANGILGKVAAGTGTNRAVFRTSGSLEEQQLYNCVAVGGNGANGAAFGFLIETTAAEVYNCDAYGIKATSPNLGKGFKVTGANCFVQNCIGAGSHLADFDLVASTDADFNCSSDSTATGEASLTLKSATAVFYDAPATDFRLKSDSPALNKGVDLSEIFETDIVDEDRDSPWDMGAHNGSVSHVNTAIPTIVKGNRFATCWLIERRDGVTYRYTDHNHTLQFNGHLWLPAGGFAASARRSEAGLKETNLEIQGVLAAPEITDDDLRAGFFAQAKIVEFIVDHRYPWTKPFEKMARWILDMQWTSEGWKVTLGGITSFLKQKEGRTTSRTCGLIVFSKGDKKCNATKINFQNNIAVTQVDSARHTFRASGLANLADEYFALGKLKWLTGDNVGVDADAKHFTNSGKIVELQIRMPFDIQVGDTFNLRPGCDGQKGTCKTKFNNLINFGGEPYSPGTDRQLNTPQR